MNLTEYMVKLVTTEPMLGTVPKNPEVYKNFIAVKACDAGLAEEEIATVQSIEEKGWTGFHKDEHGTFIYDYWIKGFLCEAARTVKQIGLMKQLQDKFKRYVHVTPRRIRLPEPSDVIERPLRAMTAQGPRVTVVRSDVVAPGCELIFKLSVLKAEGVTITKKHIEEVLEYGKFIGLGQWRTGGYGRFDVAAIDEA